MTTQQIHAAKSTIRGGDWQRKGLPKRTDPHGVKSEATWNEVTWYSEQLLDGELDPLRKWLGRGSGKADRAIVAEWRGERLYRLHLSQSSAFPSEALDAAHNGSRSADSQDPALDRPNPSQVVQRECRAFLEQGLVGLLRGESEPIPWERLMTEDRTEFQQRVLQLCYQIPFGETLSYKALAERAGRPLAARAVGQTMATNRIPLLIPCHRVIAANRTLCGFSAPGGIDTKRQLLALESELAAERKSSW